MPFTPFRLDRRSDRYCCFRSLRACCGAGRKTPDPYTIGATAGVTGAAVVTEDFDSAGLPKRSGSSPAAWIAVAIALLFGLTIGFVLFNKQQGKTIEVVKYVDRPVPGVASGAANGDKVTSIDESTVGVDPKNASKHVATSPKANTSAEPDKGLAGLKGLTGLSGPRPKSRSGQCRRSVCATVGTGQLDGGQIQSTVARYTGSVKRACWQPALDTRDKDAPTTARVNVAITVMPSGSVQSATVGGDQKGYRGLSQCISSRVRGWQFPPSGDTTTVNVPVRVCGAVRPKKHTRQASLSGVVAASRKPGSVACLRCLQRAGGHSSGTLVAERLVRPTQGLGRTTLERPSTWPCSGWGLPCRNRYRLRGGLLPHLFTLTRGAKAARAVCFSVALSSSFPHRALPGILPCGARTFLEV